MKTNHFRSRRALVFTALAGILVALYIFFITRDKDREFTEAVAKSSIQAQLDIPFDKTPAPQSQPIPGPTEQTTPLFKTKALNSIDVSKRDILNIKRESARRNMLSRYGSLIDELELSPAELIRLGDLLAEQLQVAQDAQDILKARGVDPKSEKFQALYKELINETDLAIKSFLGSERYELFKTIPDRASFKTRIQEWYSIDFKMEGIPLSERQTSDLATAMAIEMGPSLRNLPSAEKGRARHSEWLYVQDYNFLKRAEKILNSQQMAVLKARIENDNFYHQASEANRNSSSKK